MVEATLFGRFRLFIRRGLAQSLVTLQAMKPLFLRPAPLTFAAVLTLIAAESVLRGAETPDLKPKDLNTPRQFPPISSAEEWQQRGRLIREQAQVSCGLWPMPTRTELKPRIFGRVEREGYSIEKVAIETYPGVFLGGNLYRPLGKGPGPFPAVLNPHGHWANGRMADEESGSIAARCITFARLGIIAFSYDMLGYNDTFFPDHGVVPVNQYYVRHRRFATNQVCQLWSISQMGLQTWNSIRALDFLLGLPGVDPRRVACTGESGGGTQTFLLGAIDNRLTAQAPVVMVSHSMQGGCSCENAPGLRVEYSNMEFAAAAAPRPQIVVAATGDWTKDTPTVEGPAIENVYQLLGFPRQFRHVRFDFGHNYNQTSREAVYGWFNRWLLRKPQTEPLPEPAYKKEADADLRVFPDDRLPEGAITEAALIDYLKRSAEEQFRSLVPKDKNQLDGYSRTMMPAWAHTLQMATPPPVPTAQATAEGAYTLRNGEDPLCHIEIQVGRPRGSGSRAVIIDGVTDPEGSQTLQQALLEEGLTVLRIVRFSPVREGDPFANFFTTYNRTRAQQRVRDVVTTTAFAREQLKAAKVFLCGNGISGAWMLLASPAADGVAADARQLDYSDDQALLSPELFYPGMKRAGGFQGATLLAAPNPLLVHNTGDKFPLDLVTAGYQAVSARKKLETHKGPLTPKQLARWLSRQ